MKAYRTKGFTLIEVTLAIVIGIIMIAGATLIYNQAKASAGNSRAQAKSASLQSLIEQYMARADGVAPETEVLRALWERARPDDWNKSPWGGVMGPLTQVHVAPAGTRDTKGILDGIGGNFDTAAGSNIVRAVGTDRPSGAVAAPPADNWSGALIYYKFPDANPYYMWDENRRSLAQAKSYSVCTTNQQGERWFFVRGNTAGLSGDESSLNIQGKIQN